MTIFDKYKKIYLSGIGGIGVSAIARLFKYHNAEVSGSDARPSSITDDLERVGIKINWSQVADNIDKDIDLFIYTPALPMQHPERQAAIKNGLTCYSYPEFLGVLSQEYKTIAVSGTHGKSTTTAMLGLMMSACGFDPTVIVGSQVDEWDHNLRIGKSEYLVLEACEYRGHMLSLHPAYTVLTNIEPDHLDYYKDLDDIKHHFSRFIEQTSSTDRVWANIDNIALKDLIDNYQLHSWGFSSAAQIWAGDIDGQNGQQNFVLYKGGKPLQKFNLFVPGRFNIANAVGALAIIVALGGNLELAAQALAKYRGCWRRFELLGQVQGVDRTILVSDYAHHPTAVKATIKAARDFYPERRIVVAFQPHQHNRTKKLFYEFSKAFGQADIVLLNPIYDVAGREEKDDQDVSSKILAQAIKKQTGGSVSVSESLEDTKKILQTIIKPGDIVIVMGAGDIDEIARQLRQTV
ncbi:MAG: UDP-N-acetylmuramate--L-alanine ligase [Candidatus Komeilibacteria bacterium]